MLWIIGNIFNDAHEYLRTHAVEYGVLVPDSTPLKPGLRNLRTVALDFSSPDALRASAQAAQLDVSAILSAGYDNYVLPAAVLSELYQVPGLSVEAAHAATDKAVMRAAFAAASSDISPDFQLVSDWSDIDEFMIGHDYPVMLKPTNLMKSLYITKNESLEELRAHYDEMREALATVAEKYYTMLPPQIIIEECMTGSMHTVAGYADDAGQIHLLPTITDCLTGHDVGKAQNYIYSRTLPSRLDSETQTEILHVAETGAQALGLTSCMLHIELMLTTDGPKIIEIGARIGGYRARMHKYIDDIDLMDVMFAIAQGAAPTLVPRQTGRAISVIELFADDTGSFTGLHGQTELEKLSSLLYLSVKTKLGQPTGRSDQGYKAAAIVMLGSEDQEQLDHDLAYVRANVSVILAE